MIGFGRGWDQATGRNPKQYIEPRSCSMCLGVCLIKKKDSPGIEMCPNCGYECKDPDYIDEWNPTGEDNIEGIRKGKFHPSGTKIISGKKQKKYYSENGEEITDPTLIQDLLQGKTIVSYHEEKSGEDKPVTVKK